MRREAIVLNSDHACICESKVDGCKGHCFRVSGSIRMALHQNPVLTTTNALVLLDSALFSGALGLQELLVRP